MVYLVRRTIEMKKEQIITFEEKKVKLVQYPNFVLSGIIDEVFDDCLRFSTHQAVSIIDFKAIKEIQERR